MYLGRIVSSARCQWLWNLLIYEDAYEQQTKLGVADAEASATPLSTNIVFTARRYASAVCRRVFVCPAVRLSVRLSQAGIVSKPLNTESRKQRHKTKGIRRTFVRHFARFQLTRRVARSLGDSWASCFIDSSSSVFSSQSVDRFLFLSQYAFIVNHLCRFVGLL